MSEQTINQNHQGGVKTAEGKAISRYNAQKHTILRETITDYEMVDAQQIYNDLVSDLNPEGSIQELLLEIIASNSIRLQRIAKAESEIIKEALSPDPLVRSLSMSDLQYNAQISSAKAEKLLIYSRYQTATENRIYRALSVYKQLKSYEQS